MHDLIRKPMTVALAAVLLFCTIAPVPTGAAFFDRARVEYAHANAAAGTAAQMALYALTAACIAQGIYVAGTTISEFNINSQEIYDAFADYYTAQNDISASELEAILAGSYTNGNVDLSALTAAGITGAIPGFASVLMNGGNVVSGSTSIENTTSSVFQAGNHSIPMYTGNPPYWDNAQVQQKAQIHANNGRTVCFGYTVKAQAWWYNNVLSPRYYLLFSDSNNVTLRERSGCLEHSSGTFYVVQVDVSTDGVVRSVSSGSSSGIYLDGSEYSGQLSSACNFTVANVAGGAVATAYNGALAVIADGVTAGTFAGTNQGIVQAFEPTAEQLQAGYDASILQGVEQAVADLGTISTGIAALDATMNGLLGVCQGIASTLSNTVVGQYCAAVTQWLGATPFGTVMGTVIDGLDDIPDAVADGAAVVAGGVAALPGALEGVIEGVLEGVFGQPLAIPGFLQDILAGVQAIPGALEGAIEGITFPEWRWPEAPEIPRVNGEPVPFAVPADLITDMRADLRDKVPFCYLIRIGESLGTLFGNLQTSRSFYFDMDVPVAGSVHFDGEGFLNQPLLGSNIADVIRICATALLCTGLLYGAYKVAREL